MKTAHEFAIYYSDLTQALARSIASKAILIQDADLRYRIERVLRIEKAEEFILFDQEHHARCVLEAFENRKSVRLLIISMAQNRQLKPELHVWLPILKRDDLEEALYSLVELGANHIHLVNTRKIQRAWGGAKEIDRLHRIMIAAAEQSKNYAFPSLYEPIPLDAALSMMKQSSHLIFFDVGGSPLLPMLQEINSQSISRLDIIIGPEGDLTPGEKQQLHDTGAITIALTPTILRARQAIALGVGVMRAAISN